MTHRAAEIATVALLAAALAGCGQQTRTATQIHERLSQMQKTFGDGRLLSASLSGSTLTVTVSDPTQPAAVSAGFEAQMLAAAVHASTPITSVDIAGANPDPYNSPGGTPGLGLYTLESRAGRATQLPDGTCKSVAESVRSSSLAVRSVLSFPYGDGACAFRFQTSTPPTYTATGPLYGELMNGMGEWAKHGLFFEVDNKRGVPVLAESWTPNGGGQVYTKPGARIFPARYSVRDVTRSFAAQGIELRDVRQPGLPKFIALLDGRPGTPVDVYVSRGPFTFTEEGHHVRLRDISGGALVHPGGCRCIFKPPISQTRLLSWGNLAVARRLADESAVDAALEGLR